MTLGQSCDDPLFHDAPAVSPRLSNEISLPVQPMERVRWLRPFKSVYAAQHDAIDDVQD